LPKSDKEYHISDDKKESKKKKKARTKFPIYKTKKNYYVVVENREEIKEAKILAEEYNAKIVTLEKYLVE